MSRRIAIIGSALLLSGGCSQPARTTVTPATVSSSHTVIRMTASQPAETLRPVVKIIVPGAEAVHATSGTD